MFNERENKVMLTIQFELIIDLFQSRIDGVPCFAVELAEDRRLGPDRRSDERRMYD